MFRIHQLKQKNQIFLTWLLEMLQNNLKMKMIEEVSSAKICLVLMLRTIWQLNLIKYLSSRSKMKWKRISDSNSNSNSNSHHRGIINSRQIRCVHSKTNSNLICHRNKINFSQVLHNNSSSSTAKTNSKLEHQWVRQIHLVFLSKTNRHLISQTNLHLRYHNSSRINPIIKGVHRMSST